MIKMEFDLSVMLEGIEGLEKKVTSAVRPAIQAGAQVYYDGMKARVAQIGKVSGNLDDAIYQKYSSERSRKGESAEYHISWNGRKAPHGHLVEFGHIAKFVSYVGKDGKWHTAVRPEMVGKPKPRAKASFSEKAAYYVLRKTPIQVAAQSFVRSTYEAKKSDAAQAVLNTLDRLIK